MPVMRLRLMLCLFALACPPAAEARTLCTALEDATSGQILLQQGDCTTRVTPASTFKIAISLMGYDSGFLRDMHSPALPFRAGTPDWLPEWRQTTDPARWITYSVVWYSQVVTQALGEPRFRAYVDAFQYGNRDVSGHPGRHDGLTEAWLSSSLKISPLEQMGFLAKMVDGALPVSPHARDMTRRITAVETLPDGWDIHGKTGTGSPALPDGTGDTVHTYGWFVGWAVRGAHRIVFARLIQDERPVGGRAGLRARNSFLSALPGYLAALVPARSGRG